jgi:hypothetical protein
MTEPGPLLDEHMRFMDGICRFAPEGTVTLVQGVEWVTAAIAFCRDQKMSKLLVNVTQLRGYAAPTLADRFWMAQDWAEAAKGAVAVAMVAREEDLHPNRFGIKAAIDAGLKGAVFTSEDDAWAWLRADVTGSADRGAA